MNAKEFRRWRRLNGVENGWNRTNNRELKRFDKRYRHLVAKQRHETKKLRELYKNCKP